MWSADTGREFWLTAPMRTVCKKTSPFRGSGSSQKRRSADRFARSECVASPCGRTFEEMKCASHIHCDRNAASVSPPRSSTLTSTSTTCRWRTSRARAGVCVRRQLEYPTVLPQLTMLPTAEEILRGVELYVQRAFQKVCRRAQRLLAPPLVTISPPRIWARRATAEPGAPARHKELTTLRDLRNAHCARRNQCSTQSSVPLLSVIRARAPGTEDRRSVRGRGAHGAVPGGGSVAA